MTAATVLRPSVRAAFDAFIDYAGLFPPEQLSLGEAQHEYSEARRGPHGWMLGRFIVPAPLLVASSGALEGPFSVIVDAESPTLEAVAALRENAVPVETLEIPLRPELSHDEIRDAIDVVRTRIAGAKLEDLQAFVEIPRSQRWAQIVPPTMRALREWGLGAKLRCGGVTAQAFPTVDEVAEFVALANESSVPFKATAGLHHPVRHLDAATGFAMHGFLNLLAAAALASRVERDTLVRIVAEEEPSAFRFEETSFAWRDEGIGMTELRQTREEVFVSYGSCSFSEPVADLNALGAFASR